MMNFNNDEIVKGLEEALKKKLPEFIDVIIPDSVYLEYVIPYLNMTHVDAPSKDGMASLSLHLEKFVAKMNSSKISVAITRDMMMSLNNINAEAEILNQILNDLAEDVTCSYLINAKQCGLESVKKDWDWKDKFKNFIFTKILRKEYKKVIKVKDVETKHRQVLQHIMANSNMLMRDGRFGPCNFAIVSVGMALVLQDSADYVYASTHLSDVAKNFQVYPIGQVGRITIYVDANLKFADNTVILGRTGNKEEPGIKSVVKIKACNLVSVHDPENPSQKYICFYDKFTGPVSEQSKTIYRTINFKFTK